jgi:hypothetical protein
LGNGLENGSYRLFVRGRFSASSAVGCAATTSTEAHASGNLDRPDNRPALHQQQRPVRIYVRPSGEHRFTVLDDLNETTLARLSADGLTPCAIVETSAGNFQAWLKHPAVFPKLIGTFAAQTLAGRYDADPSAADWRRFGRLPGFTNCKPKYRKPDGLFPFVRLKSNSGEQYPMAEVFVQEITKLYEEREQEREERRIQASLSPQRGPRLSNLSLERFRTSTKYRDRPAAADIAFCVAAYANGMTEDRMSKWRYVDYQIALIAPLSIIKRSPREVEHFDIAISYEDIGNFVPEFRHACTTMDLPAVDVEPTQQQLLELRALQALLHGLIHIRILEFKANPNLELPDLVSMVAGKQADLWFPIPGMAGGFQIRLIQDAKNEFIVFAESGSRIGSGWMRHKVTLFNVRSEPCDDLIEPLFDEWVAGQVQC